MKKVGTAKWYQDFIIRDGEIKNYYHVAKWGYSKIARHYGISRQRVHQIINNYKSAPSSAVIGSEKCQDCGTTVARLETHHIDGNTGNNKPKNLLALCRKCHSLRHPRSKEYRIT